MSIRTIMIFPEIEDVKIIDAIREKYDPLAGLVRPHITIVFPFESPMSNRDIEEITSIHDVLYGNEFREYDLGLGYKPHMTVGKLPTAEALEAAYEQVKAIDINVRTVVNKISVEMIGESEESIIIIEHAL